MSKKSYRRSTRRNNIRRKTRRGGVKLRNVATAALLTSVPTGTVAPSMSRPDASALYERPAGPVQQYTYTEPQWPQYVLPKGSGPYSLYPDPHPKPYSNAGNMPMLGRHIIKGMNNTGYTINTSKLYGEDPKSMTGTYSDVVMQYKPEIGETVKHQFMPERTGSDVLTSYYRTSSGVKKNKINLSKNKTISGVKSVTNLNRKRMYEPKNNN